MPAWFGSVAEWLSAAWPRGSERRFYDGHDRKVDGSTPTQVPLLRPSIRSFMAIISAWRNLRIMEEFIKQQIEEVRSKIQTEKSETRAASKRVWIRPMHSASVAFS